MKGRIKCPYCTNIADEHESIYSGDLGNVEIQNNYIYIILYDNNSIEKKIKYCPICGKRLKENNEY